MKFKKESISILSEDIHHIVRTAHGHNFDMLRLCSYHENSVILSDNRPVLDISQDDLVGIFDQKSNHYFLNAEHAFRLAVFCDIQMFAIVSLMLKSVWEEFIANILGYYRKDITSLGAALKDKNIVNKYIPNFVPDKGEIIKCIGNSPEEFKRELHLDQIEYVIADLLKDCTFLKPSKTISNLYAGQLRNERILLSNVTDAEIKKYYQLKELWKYKTSELSDVLFLLERKKRVYVNLENEYMRNFGNLEIKKIRQIKNVEKYAAVIKLMKEKPLLTYRELIASVSKELQKFNRQHQELQSKISRSKYLLGISIPGDTQSVITTEFKKSYAKQCKTLLKKLYFLLHTDTCPGYSELSEIKKKQINKLWLQLLDSSQNELYAYSPTMLLYQYPDIEILEELYVKACNILGITPNFVETGDHLEFVINKGTSFPKVIEFLTAETEKIEMHLAQIELVQQEYTHEAESQFYRFAMENANKHKENLNKEIRKLKQKVSKLKDEISNNLIKEKV